MDLWLNYVDQILLYATLAISLNLLLGYAGQVSVAHASLGAIGGYGAATWTCISAAASCAAQTDSTAPK